MQAEKNYVEQTLGGKVICSRCGATLDSFASQCTADLDDACPGFIAIDAAKLEFDRSLA